MKVIVLIVIPIIFIVSSCAKNEIKPEINPGPVQLLESVPLCDETQRNLTHAWQDRKYWCAQKSRVDAIKKQNHIMRLASIRETRLELLRINESLKKTILTKGVAPKTKQKPQVRKLQIVSDNNKATPLAEKNKSVNRSLKTERIISVENSAVFNDLERVMFASHREALGPKGRLSTETIALAASGASYIRLRGFLAKDEELAEVGKTHEQFSVGRALSVKNKLVEHGIPKNRITILHHQNIRPGAFVEVVFND